MIINSPYVSGSLTVSCNINVCGTINGTANICTSTLFASTRVCSPNLCATTTICGPAFVGGTMSGTTLYGSTAACAPTVFGTTAVCSPTIFASTVACAPTVFGTTAVCSPTVFGTTAVCAPTVFGTTRVCSANLCATTTICGPSFVGGTFSGTTVSGTTLYGSTAVCAPTVFGTTAVCAPTVFGTTVVCGGSVCTTGNICAAGSITGSAILSTGRITAQTLVVSTISSSVTFSSGSNIFGNSTANTQTMTGSVNITGSLTITTTAPELTVGATGVTLGNVITDIHNVTGSLRTTGSITGVGNACFTSVCSPSYTGGTFSGTTISGTTLYGSTAVCAPTVFGTTAVCSPTVFGTTRVCSANLCATTTICGPAFIGGTVTGTTLYGSTAICGGAITGTTAVLTNTLKVGQCNNGEMFITIGECRTASGFAYIDFIGDTTYTDYGLRLIRGNAGANSTSQLVHRGTGDLQINTDENASIQLRTCATDRVRITGAGCVGIGTGNPCTTLDVRGDVVLIKSTTVSAAIGGPILSLGDTTSEVGMAGGISFTENLSSSHTGVTMGIYYDGINNKMHIVGECATTVVGCSMICAPKHITILRDSGCVGIGTTNPGANLHVAGRIRTSNTQTSGAADASGIIQFGDNNVGLFRGTANSLAAGNLLNIAANDGIVFTVQSGCQLATQCERMRITSGGTLQVKPGTTGGIEIGTTTTAFPTYLSIVNDGNTSGVVVAQARGAGQFLTSAGAGDMIIGASTGENILFGNTQTGTTEYMRITSGGISCFSGTVCAPEIRFCGGNAAINNYEVGTWTPHYNVAGSCTGVTYYTRFGYYRRIGDMVTIWGGTRVCSNGSGTGEVKITGLPFTINCIAAYTHPAGAFSKVDSGNCKVYSVLGDTTALFFREQTATGDIAASDTCFPDGTSLLWTMTYIV